MSQRSPRIHLVPLVILVLALLTALSLQAPKALAQPAAQKAIPHPVAGQEKCLMCHQVGGVKPVPADHSSYAETMCVTCHKEASTAQPTAQPTQAPAQPTQAPTQVAAQPTPIASGPPDITHTLEGRADCVLCHQTGGTKPVPASHASYTNQLCLSCHKAASAAQPTPQPTPAAVTTDATPTKAATTTGAPNVIPHALEGRAACSTCHGIAGSNPYPKDHVGRPDSGCLQCHATGKVAAPGTTTLAAGNETCLACHKQTDLTTTLPGGEKLNLFIDGEAFGQSVHGQKGLQCTACHPNMTQFPHPALTVKTERELNRGVVQQACATCHKAIYDIYKDSVHGNALLNESNTDVPSCTDCHGIHNISDPRTALFRANSPDLCSTCHSDAKLMSTYGISANVTKTYMSDFHGTSVRLTKEAQAKDPNITTYKAVCYDCHGIHDIKKVSDPNSSVVKENLVKTCQKCHPNADANFPAAWTSHYIPDRTKWPLVYLVDLFYKIFVPTVLGGMIAFIGLDLAHALIVKRKSGRSHK